MKPKLTREQKILLSNKYREGSRVKDLAREFHVCVASVFLYLRQTKTPHRYDDGGFYRLQDLTGKTFGKLFVVGQAGKTKDKKEILWNCQCSCGNKTVVRGKSLRKGYTRSCGCLKQCPGHFTHRMTGSPEFLLWSGAKQRARRKHIEFSLDIKKIQIPERCPVLGILLKKGDRGFLDSSPTLDRIDPQRGYQEDNVQVISFRANRIKSDSTLEELRKVLRYRESMEGKSYND